MRQYIDKAAVVAEVEKRIKENKVEIERAPHKHLEEYFEGYEDALVLFKEKFLDTLEMKEVDLEKELDRYTNSAEYVYNETRDSYFLVAKHFFELGIRSKATKASEFLKKHFEETPQEELDKEWKEIEPLNDIGPDVLEYTDKKEK